MSSYAGDSLTSGLDAESFATGTIVEAPATVSCAVAEHESTASAVEPASPEIRVHGLAESMLIMLALMVVQRGIGFIRGILFCRWLPVEELGQWDLAYDFLLMAGPIAVLALPGCFGRYVEYYRQRDQLRTFLCRLALVCGLLAAAAVATVMLAAPWFARLFFGNEQFVTLTLVWAGTLGIAVVYNFFTELFMALRQSRLTAMMQFVNGLTFATVSLLLVILWKPSATVVLIGFATACVVSVGVGLLWLRATWRALPAREAPLSAAGLWGKILPFVIWVWVSNWLTNLFGLAARYMIIHFSGMPSEIALQQVGEYHASRIVPLLLETIAFMLSGILTPYLSHDWEAGRFREVSARSNLSIKLSSLGLMVGGLGILLMSGPLFEIAFENKYALGKAILPMTLAYCCWFGLTTIVQSYLWCAERARQGSLALLAGLVVNVVLNFAWLPVYGLWGAVLATFIGNFITLSLVYSFALLHRLSFDPGTAILLAAPGVFALGVWPTLAVLLGLAIAIACGKLVRRDEQAQLIAFARQYLDRVPYLRRSLTNPS
ncbi:MAG: lipopolysaccharide biosynthesis protein [Pirellulales bacterium]|nr:lipopolysaccharide biosynthesis protein [Pirellulales bacterium]